eukprot:Skav227166  [mRNA]  locus=scaffold502:374186:380853:- [translate_table: standard]
MAGVETQQLAATAVDHPRFLGFLTLFARFSFAYWLIDMPLHVVFGLEINGAQEQRPKKLLKTYLRSWFPVDLFIVSVDAVIITLEVLQESNNDEFSMWRSARFFRTLRLLRLLRLLRVTKLQNEALLCIASVALMILANQFLSTNAFLMLKALPPTPAPRHARLGHRWVTLPLRRSWLKAVEQDSKQKLVDGG